MDNFLDYINQSSQSLLAEEKSLREDDRTDDANLVKIKNNIYQIAKAFYKVTAKLSTKESFAEEFEKRIRKPYSSWQSSYEKAKEHNDVEKIVIEELKMQTLDEIIKKSKEL